MKIAVINGPNMKLLGIREPSVYGEETYKDLCRKIKSYAKKKGVKVSFFQSDCEGEIVEYIGKLYKKADGIIINPGAYTHTSIAIRDAISGTAIPAFEVHISNVDKREDFRRQNFIRPVCFGGICGKGTDGYLMGIDAFSEKK